MATFKFGPKFNPKDFEKEVNKQTEQKFKRSLDAWKLDAPDLLKKEMNASIDRGVSPVEGGGGQTGGNSRFVRYSPSYERKINRSLRKVYGKQIRPVNLKVTGKMRDSLRVRPNAKGLFVEYTDEKADYHNFLGASKRHVIRALLPIGGQNFSRVITSKLTKLFSQIFKTKN